jgi:aldose 1-epimerase
MTTIFLNSDIARIEISPELGGAILVYDAKLHNKFVPILRNSRNAESVLNSSCFPLVPYSNRIKHGLLNWQEKSSQLPLNHLPEKHSIHGHGWQLPWKVIHKTETSLTLEYNYKKAEWPFSYSARQVFTLKGSSLNIELSLVNHSTSQMPAGLGLHPYFSLTKATSLKCSVERMWAVDNESMPTTLAEAPTELASSEGLLIPNSNLDNVLTGFSGAATITWPEWKAKADVTSSSNCKFIVVYSPQGQSYFCFEPVTHSTDAINMSNNGDINTGINTLNPQEELSVSMCITPKET